VADVREILVRITGDSADAERKLNEVARNIIKTGRIQARPSIDLAGVAEANAQLAGMAAELRLIDAMNVSPEVRLRADRALTQVERLRGELDDLPKRLARKQEAVIDVQTNLDDVGRQLADARQKVDALPRRAVIELQVKRDELRAALAETQRELRDLTKQPHTVEIQAQIAAAKARITELNAAIREVDATDPRLVFKAETAAALAEVARLKAAADVLTAKKQKLEIGVDRDTKALPELLGRIGSSAAGIAGDLGRVAGPANDLNSKFHGVLGAVKQINPVIQGFSLIIVTLAIPAIIALASSFGAAVVGAGALATALAATLGPTILGLVGLFQRFGGVLKTLTAEQAAVDAADKKNATNIAARTQAYRARVDATNSVSDAERSRKRAVETLAQAEQQAQQAIADAQRKATQATRDLADARVQAYREMEDAADAARHAVLNLESAQLSKDEASLGVKQAKQDLAEYRQQLKLTDTAVGQVFQKFSDVEVNFDAGAFDKAISGASGGKVNTDDLLELQRRILAVRRAKLNEKQATENVADAERDNTRAKQDNQKFLKKGITASGQYAAALERSRDAHKELSRLEATGVQNAPGVIAARQGVADATRAVARAELALRRTIKDNAGIGGATAQMATFLTERRKLSKAERDFNDRLFVTKQLWKQISQTAFAPVFDAASTALGVFAGNLDSIQGLLSDLGKIWADNLTGFVINLKIGPGIKDGLKTIVDGAKEISRLAGPIFTDLFSIFVRIAQVAMPGLIKGFQSVADGLSAFRFGKSQSKGFADGIKVVVGQFGKWAKLGGAVIGSVLKFFVAAAPEAGKLVDWITKGVKAFGKWASSGKGSAKISAFFKDVVPLAKSLITFIINLGKAFLNVVQFLAPAFKVVLDSFNFLLDVFNFIMGILNKIPAPIRGLLGLFFPFGAVLGRIGKVVKTLGGFFISAFGKGAKVVGDLIGPIRRLIGWLGSRLPKVVRGVFAPFRWVGGKIKSLWDNVFSPTALYTRVHDAFLAVKNFVMGSNNPIIRGFRWVADRIVGLFRALKSRLFSAFGFVGGLVKSVVNGVISVLNFFIDKINKVTPGKIKVFGHTIFPGVPDIPSIPMLASGGVTTGATLAAIGEKGREAVLPLQGAALREVADAIVTAMGRLPSRGLVTATAGAGRGGGAGPHTVIREQHINVQAAGGGVLDATDAAVKLGRLLKRRGGVG
jgi:hypothetical protein